METIYIDIETLPTESSAVKAHIASNLKPPGNITKAESIEKWIANPENLNKAIDKTGLSGLFGTIACIGVATETGDVTILSGSEKEMLQDFLKIIRRAYADEYPNVCQQHRLVGHNLKAFDAPFINQRMLVHGLGPLFPFEDKPWNNDVMDTMLMFQAGNRDYIKLVDLCASLGVDKPLDEIDGSQVAQAWREFEFDMVFDHCRSDVIATRSCYQRMMITPGSAQEAAA